MDLHADRDAFETLLLSLSERSTIRADILEKDYYVTLFLAELSSNEAAQYTFFKGGTALYKALGVIQRFSEDLDLTVEVSDCASRSAASKRLDNATKFLSLRRNKSAADRHSESGITRMYAYDSVVAAAGEDELQRFESVKVEATSFTISEPHEPLQIEPVLYTLATESEREIFSRRYAVNPLRVETILIERIFIDKVFAAQFYLSQNRMFDAAKHLYDVAVLCNQPKIEDLLSRSDVVSQLIGLVRTENQHRHGAGQTNESILGFDYFQSGWTNAAFESAYFHMQSVYVFSEEYYISIDILMERLLGLRHRFEQLRL